MKQDMATSDAIVIKTQPITKIEIGGLWGKYNVELNLYEDVNILIGDNGSGKTTILELIHACLLRIDKRNDYKFNFVSIEFREKKFVTEYHIEGKVPFYKGDYKYKESEILVREKGIISYNLMSDFKPLPHEFINISKINTFEFRIKETNNITFKTDKNKSQLDIILTNLQNDYKGYLLHLRDQEEEADTIFKTLTKEYLKNFSVEKGEKLKKAIEDKEKRVAEINTLKDRFETLVNKFFGGGFYQGRNRAIYSYKEIDYDKNNSIIFQLKETREKVSINQLSSGEKQLLIILLTTLLQQEEPAILLLDEPEISLHVAWQEHLIESIRALNKNCQIIIVTHSPDIPGRYLDNEININTALKLKKQNV